MLKKSKIFYLIFFIWGGMTSRAIANPELEAYQSPAFQTPELNESRPQPFLVKGEAIPPLVKSDLTPSNFKLEEKTAILAQNPLPEGETEETPSEVKDQVSPPPDSPPTSQEKTSVSSPLRFFSGTQPTAWQLGEGQVVLNFYNRLFDLSSGSSDGTGAYPDVGFTWGITDTTELTLEYQQVDTGAPGNQGEFSATRKTDNLDADFTIELKQRLWQNSSQTQFLSGVVSLSWGDRGFHFNRDGEDIYRSNSSIVPALQLPFSAWVDEKWELTIAPTLAFFSDNSALYWHVLPTDDPGSFGTTFGFSGAVAYHVNSRLKLWGDLFVPLAGNNSIMRSSGFPTQTIAYNAGMRYLVNPRAGFEVFVSNRLGTKGALALTADSSLTALGTGFFVMPDFIPGNRNSPDSFKPEFNGVKTPFNVYGLGLFERETLNSGDFFFSFLGGGQGISTALSYGLVKDAEVGIFLEYTSGTTDEGLQGLSGRLRIFNQFEGAPLTVSVAATVSQTNSPFVNYYFNNRNEFKERNLDKNVPFLLQDDNTETGELFVVTLSVPLQYQFKDSTLSAIWLTPTLGYVQRLGTELLGFNAGGLISIIPDVSLMGEIGINFLDPGNVLLDNGRGQAIPWTLAIQWDPSSLLGLSFSKVKPKVHFYVTNSVGFSPWLQLRVQQQNSVSVGAGFSIPF